MTRAMVDSLTVDLTEAQRADAYGVAPTSVAYTVVFLASDESSDPNGAAIRLDRDAVSLP
jgi:hypothetical protein